MSKPELGMDPAAYQRLARCVDLAVNSSGLTDFNPDLRDALASNIDSAANLVEFLRESSHAALLHLSTCYVVGARDGRIGENCTANYTPAQVPDFDAKREWLALQETVRKVEMRAQSPEVEAALRRQAQRTRRNGEEPPASEIDNLIRKNRMRWLRNHLTQAGTRRAKHFGWPNTYTFTKSLGESLLATRGRGIADRDCAAFDRGDVGAASLPRMERGHQYIGAAFLLAGHFFPATADQQTQVLDLIPVDMVCRGMTLIATALIERRHERVYQLATSGSNPCDMEIGDRTDGAGASQALPRAAGPGALAADALRHHSGVERAIRKAFHTGAKGAGERHQPGRRGPAIQAAATGAGREGFGSRRKTDRPVRAVILHNEQIFESENVQMLSAALPAEERESFGYEPGTIDWWDYWINIHIPALRKWVYPLIEGHAVESRRRREFRLAESLPPGEIRAAEASSTRATWPLS